MRFEDAVEIILSIEGPLSNRPKNIDPGGITNWGISLAAFPELGEAGIRNLTRDGAKPLYYVHYWKPSKAESLPLYLRLMMFDFAVHSGPHTAARKLQLCLNRFFQAGLLVDGSIGPKTLKVISKADPRGLVLRYARERQLFLRSLPNYSPNANGWENRVLRILVELINVNRK